MSISIKLRSGILIIASIFLISFHTDVQAQDSTATASTSTLDAELVASGDMLFKNNCLVCHDIHSQKVGPALANVYERRSVEWIKAFITNSQKVIQSGDEYAVALYKQYNNTVMTSFDFSDQEKMALIEYIKSETIKGPPLAVAAAATTSAGATPQQESILSKTTLVVLLIVLLSVLVMILVVLFILVTVLTKYLKQKSTLSPEDQEVVFQRFQLGTYIRSPGFIWIVTFIFTALVIKTVIDGLFGIGVQQNYAPTQPIVFSHKVHAGDFKIDCNYCHTGVRISKSANIPSVNICLNCHSSILKITGATEMSTEIQKIYEAKQSNTPIQWVRVHNLPDLAYFNHAQHFNVGGITCQTCHGAVETMDVLKQQTNLTMGWCIDCHRKTEIKVDNGYYDRLSELHAKTSKKPMVVEDIGGLECSKCHY